MRKQTTTKATRQRRTERKRADAAFLAWITTLPSCISGEYSEFLESGEGRSVACHVRRSLSAGTGFKPPFSAVPLTFEEHAFQHERGEIACLLARLPAGVAFNWEDWGPTPWEAGKAWFDAQAAKYRDLWFAEQP